MTMLRALFDDRLHRMEEFRAAKIMVRLVLQARCSSVSRFFLIWNQADAAKCNMTMLRPFFDDRLHRMEEFRVAKVMCVS